MTKFDAASRSGAPEAHRDNGDDMRRDPVILPIAKQRITPISYRRILERGSSNDEDAFCAKIRDRLGAETWTIPLGRARSGIYLLAKLALREGRRKVLMSPFTIPDIVIMVMLAGAEPIFFDFEPDSAACDLQSLKAQIDEETACVLITHYHVNEPSLSEIAQLCHTQGAYLFDDCALAFGGSIGGSPIGTLTDGSVFSFSSFKLLNFFWGGMITTHNPEIGSGIEAMVAKWPRLAPFDYLGQAVKCLTYDLASSPPLFETIVYPRFRKKFEKSPDAEGIRYSRIETTGLSPTLTSRPSLAAFSEWRSKLGAIDEWLRRRRSIARIYRQRLGHLMVGPGMPEAELDGACFVNFPVRVPRGRRDEIVRSMILSGFDVGRSLYPNVHRHPKFTRVVGQSENVDRLADGTVYLPTHFGVSEIYADAIATRLADEAY